MKNRKKIISIIIATHNNATHIVECLDSILNQSFQDIEVIVVDVCSTDGTKDILEEMAGMDERIVYITDSYGSIGRAKNIAVDLATAPYILIVEPEDYLRKDALLYFCHELDEAYGIDIFACETDCFGDDSFGRKNRDKKELLALANKKDGRKREMDSRVMRSWMFDNVAAYRTSFLKENEIRHYELPGYGRQSDAFRFLAMAKGIPSLSVAVQYERRMDISEKKIDDDSVVWDICNEFRYLKERLMEDEKLWWQVRFVFWQAYYDRNMLLYEKLSKWLRPMLSKRMQADIKNAILHKEYSRDHFDVMVREEMELLISSAEEFDRYQGEKINKRERARDKSIAGEDRVTEVFVTPKEESIHRLSQESKKRVENIRQKNRLDKAWLLNEMARDLAPLRMLLGLSSDEMGAMIGISGSAYKGLESGKREVSWDQYLALLFVFHYNERTAGVIDTLGLYPEQLKMRFKKGVGHIYG